MKQFQQTWRVDTSRFRPQMRHLTEESMIHWPKYTVLFQLTQQIITITIIQLIRLNPTKLNIYWIPIYTWTIYEFIFIPLLDAIQSPFRQPE